MIFFLHKKKSYHDHALASVNNTRKSTWPPEVGLEKNLLIFKKDPFLQLYHIKNITLNWSFPQLVRIHIKLNY